MLHTLLFLILGAFEPASAVERVPVTIVLTEAMPEEATKALVIREAGAEPRDIIMVSRHTATPKVIAAALCVYYAKRPELEMNPGRSFRFLVRSDNVPPEWNAVVIPAIAKVIAHLKRDDRPNPDGSQRSPAVEIWVPLLTARKL